MRRAGIPRRARILKPSGTRREGVKGRRAARLLCEDKTCLTLANEIEIGNRGVPFGIGRRIKVVSGTGRGISQAVQRLSPLRLRREDKTCLTLAMVSQLRDCVVSLRV